MALPGPRSRSCHQRTSRGPPMRRVARQALALGILVAACALSRASTAIPLRGTASWSQPVLGGARARWRDNEPDRFLEARGDFNGDGRRDTVRILVNTATGRP